MMKSLCVLCFSLVFTATGFAQIRAVEQFVSEQDQLSKFYIYQSTLRMLNDSGDPNFNKLIKGIRKINVYLTMNGEEVATSSYQRLIRELNQDNFEMLISAKNEGMYMTLMTRESGNNAYYVLAVKESTEFALLEMDGKLDLRYLQAFDNVNVKKLRELISKDGNTREEEEIRE